MFPTNCRTQYIQKAPIVNLLSECEIPDEVISFGQGVPFFGPPESAISAITSSLDDETSHLYTEDIGIEGLRSAISNKLKIVNEIDADPLKNIFVTSGGNYGFIVALMTITDLGDEVILLSPYYFNHDMAITLSGCKSVAVSTDSQYQPDLQALRKAITSKTKAIVTVSPNNPAGVVYSEEKLVEINNLCEESGIYHISDEAYEHFVYEDARHVSPAKYDDELEHTITIFSFSKSYGMSGLRIGYNVIPSDLHTEAIKVQDTIGICAPTLGQIAAKEVLRRDLDYPKRHLGILSEIRDIFNDKLEGIQDIEFPKTRGAFYFLLRPNTHKSSWEIVKTLIEKHKIITIPGEAFGAEFPSLRISYGNLDKKRAIQGIERLRIGLEEILGN